MPNITFANIKGGSGKTTATLVLASELYAAGGRVAILEGDPNRPHASWAARRGFPVIDAPKSPIGSAADAMVAVRDGAGDSRLVVITTDGDEESVLDWIEAAGAWATFVLSDPEGSPNQWLTQVVSQADLVLIPFAPTTLDADQVARTIRHIRQTERMARKDIRHRVLLTRANPGIVMTRDERDLREMLAKNNVPLMTVPLADRPAFRGIFKNNKLLAELTDEEANGLAKARENARAYTAEVIENLSNTQKAAA